MRTIEDLRLERLGMLVYSPQRNPVHRPTNGYVSVAKMAREIGVTQPTLTAWEAGRIGITEDRLLRYQMALDRLRERSARLLAEWEVADKDRRLAKTEEMKARADAVDERRRLKARERTSLGRAIVTAAQADWEKEACTYPFGTNPGQRTWWRRQNPCPEGSVDCLEYLRSRSLPIPEAAPARVPRDRSEYHETEKLTQEERKDLAAEREAER